MGDPALLYVGSPCDVAVFCALPYVCRIFGRFPYVRHGTSVVVCFCTLELYNENEPSAMSYDFCARLVLYRGLGLWFKRSSPVFVAFSAQVIF